MAYSKALSTFLTNRIGTLPAESQRKAKLLFNSIVLSLLFSILYIGISFVTYFVVARYAMYACVLLMSALLLLLRSSNWKLMAHLFVLIVWMLTCVLVYFSGDVLPSMLSWLALTPLVSLMLLSNRISWVWLTITLISILVFLWLPQPDSKWVFTSQWPTFYSTTLVIGLVCMIFLISNTFLEQQNRYLLQAEHHNEELRAAEEELRQSMEELAATQDVLHKQNAMVVERQQKTERYLNTLINLAMCKGILEGDKKLAYEQILSTTAQALQTSRVSIWHYHAAEHCIECMALYDKGSVTIGVETRLFETDFAEYFKAMLSEKVIVADDARQHPATRDFGESYLIPLDIYSLLDAPYIENGKFQGVICCEHQGEKRDWDQEDILFVNSISDLVCMATNSFQRKTFEKEIVQQKEQILQQNEKLLKYAAEINTINQSLEQRVSERTAALNEQNKQLTEYAFVNAHLLRGPLSRILGLAEVIRLTESKEELLKFVELMDVSTKELDAVVHRITTILNEGRRLDRESLKE